MRANYLHLIINLIVHCNQIASCHTPTSLLKTATLCWIAVIFHFSLFHFSFLLFAIGESKTFQHR